MRASGVELVVSGVKISFSLDEEGSNLFLDISLLSEEEKRKWENGRIEDLDPPEERSEIEVEVREVGFGGPIGERPCFKLSVVVHVPPCRKRYTLCPYFNEGFYVLHRCQVSSRFENQHPTFYLTEDNRWLPSTAYFDGKERIKPKQFHPLLNWSH
jgi:hypothetical protein